MGLRLIGALLCLWVFTNGVNGPNCVLKGHVLSPFGTGAWQTQIRVVQWYFVDGEPRTTVDKVVYTNEAGDYKVDLPPGVYDVFVSRGDSEPAAKKVRVVPEKDTTFDVKLVGSPATEWVE